MPYFSKRFLTDSPAVTFTTHALNEMMIFQHLSKIFARVLNATIGMNYQSGTWTTISDAAFKGRKHHLRSQRAAQCPSDDPAAKKDR